VLREVVASFRSVGEVLVKDTKGRPGPFECDVVLLLTCGRLLSRMATMCVLLLISTDESASNYIREHGRAPAMTSFWELATCECDPGWVGDDCPAPNIDYYCTADMDRK
jgi:hypothetical protein